MVNLLFQQNLKNAFNMQTNHILTLKMLVTTAADDIFILFYFFFSEKYWFVISCELSA